MADRDSPGRTDGDVDSAPEDDAPTTDRGDPPAGRNTDGSEPGSADGDADGDSEEARTGSEDGDESVTGTTAPLVFLLGAVAFFGGAAAFLADIVTGHGVVRSLLINAVAAVVLVGWAAVDTLSDPDSTVDSRSGAAGTALLLFGLYLLVAAVVVGVTSIWHGRLQIAVVLGGGAAVAVVVGFLVFPREAIVGDDG